MFDEEGVQIRPPLSILSAMKRVKAMRHTTSSQEECELIREQDCNHCAVRFDDGTICTAVYNFYTGLYYADDKYGLIPQTI